MIRRRLTFWNATIICLLTLLTSVATVVVLRRNLYAVRHARLQARAERLAKAWSNLSDIHDIPKMQTMSRRPGFNDRETEELEMVQAELFLPRIFMKDGTELLGSGKSYWAPEVLPGAWKGSPEFTVTQYDPPGSEVGPTDILVYTMLLHHKNEPDALLQIVARLDDIPIQVGQIVQLLLLIVPASWILAILSGMFLTQRAMTPIRDLNHAAQSMANKSIGERLPIRGNDEMSELASTINETYDRIEASYRQLEQFTADASHEIRSPLTAIMARMTRPDLDQLSRGELLDILHDSQKSAAHLGKLVEDLLFLAKTDQPDWRLRKEKVALDDVVGEVADRYVPLLGDRLTCDVHETLPIQGDRTMMTRLFTNLVDNAANHAGPEAHIQIVGQRVGHEVEFVVADNGVGIAPEHVEHLFERFYQANSARGGSGCGLGLALVNTVVRLHHGTIKVESEPGTGTRFVVRLPAG